MVVKPDVVVKPEQGEAKGPDSRPRCKLVFQIGAMRSTLLQEERPVWDLCVNNFSGSVLADGDGRVTTAVRIIEVQVSGSGKQYDHVPYRLLSQREDGGAREDTGDPSAPASLDASGTQAPEHSRTTPCLSLLVTANEEAETVCEIQMPKALSLSVDPHTVGECCRLQSQVIDTWRSLRHRTSALAASTGPDREAPGVRKVSGAGAVIEVDVTHAPEQLLAQYDEEGGAAPSKRMSTTLYAVGMHVLLIDGDFQEFMLLKMQDVSVEQTTLSDGTMSLSGTLGRLDITDKSAPASLHPKILTTDPAVHDAKSALVKVHVQMHDETSVAGLVSRKNVWHVGIDRPRITLLWRVVAEGLQYQQSFSSAPKRPADDHPDPCRKMHSNSETRELVDLSPSQHEADPAMVCHEPLSALRGPKSIATVVSINLEHPELIIPRSSTCSEAFLADLGRIDVERRSMHSSERWSVSFKETQLDSRHSLSDGEVTVPSVRDMDGTASINFFEAGAIRGDAEMSVDIELQRLKGTITDRQYALLMSIFGENFTEQREFAVESAAAAGPVKRQVAHLAEDGTLGDKLAGIIDLARGLTAHRVPSSCYNLAVSEVELAVACGEAPDHNSSSNAARQAGASVGCPLLHARASDLKVRYKGYAAEPRGGGESSGLSACCTAQVSCFELIDTRPSAVHKSGPLFSVKRMSGDPGSCDDESASDGARQKNADDPLVILQYFRLTQGHAGIDVMMRNVDTIFDIGLLMNAISWLGTSNGPAVASNGFAYGVTRVGGFRVQVDLPDSSIQLVTDFDQANADGFDMKGTLSVTYASSASEDGLHVKVDNLVLKVRENAQPGGARASHGMDIVRPCGVMASWQWYRELDAATAASIAHLLEADHKRRPKFYFAASEMRAMVTYENVMLALRVYSCLIDTLADSRAVQSQSQTAHGGASNAFMDADRSEGSKTPGDAASAPQDEVELRLQGAGIMLTITDDYAGRWALPIVCCTCERQIRWLLRLRPSSHRCSSVGLWNDG